MNTVENLEMPNVERDRAICAHKITEPTLSPNSIGTELGLREECAGALERYCMFMYTLRKFSDATQEHGNALAAGDMEALLQIRNDRSRNDQPDLPFQVSDDPQSDYYLEKRIAYPMGNGYTNAMRAPVEIVYVSG